MLIEQGLLEDFIQPLLKKACNPMLFAKITSCTWDPVQWTLTTKKDSNLNDKMKAFEGSSWFKDEFGLLNKANCRTNHVAPKALYKIDGGGSFNFIYHCHRPMASTAETGTTKKVGFANNNNVNSNDDSSRGSTSQLSATSSKSGSRAEELLLKKPSGGNVASASSDKEMGTSGVTGGG
jgi:hypothetical protein